MDVIVIELSTRLKQLRIDKHLKQEQVAELVGVTKSAVSAYENNLRQPSYEILIRLADLYSVTTDYLLGRSIKRSVDLSDLTTDETALVCGLVDVIADYGRKLTQFYASDTTAQSYESSESGEDFEDYYKKLTGEQFEYLEV